MIIANFPICTLIEAYGKELGRGAEIDDAKIGRMGLWKVEASNVYTKVS